MLQFYTQRGCPFCKEYVDVIQEKYREMPIGQKPISIDVDNDPRGLAVDKISQGIVPTLVFSRMKEEKLFGETFINNEQKICIIGGADERTNRLAIDGILNRL